MRGPAHSVRLHWRTLWWLELRRLQTPSALTFRGICEKGVRSLHDGAGAFGPVCIGECSGGSSCEGSGPRFRA